MTFDFEVFFYILDLGVCIDMTVLLKDKTIMKFNIFFIVKKSNKKTKTYSVAKA